MRSKIAKRPLQTPAEKSLQCDMHKMEKDEHQTSEFAAARTWLPDTEAAPPGVDALAAVQVSFQGQATSELSQRLHAVI